MPKTNDTECFTFKVTMYVQVLHSDHIGARKILDEQGGYVSRRDVEMLDRVKLLSGEKEKE
jgi:hypothetical protein